MQSHQEHEKHQKHQEHEKHEKFVEKLMESIFENCPKHLLYDQISIFLASEVDKFYCSDCFVDFDSDMPDSWVCPKTCMRNYCEECLLKRKKVCRCGEKLCD